MLDYLVTSKTRRRLLTLLWREKVTGSASELSKRARVAFAGAHRELHQMKLLGLVDSKRENGAETFFANEESPVAALMRELVKMDVTTEQTDDPASVRTRGELRTLGAPLHDEAVQVDDVEAALVRGVALAHHDPTVARVLPLCFSGARAKDVNVERLRNLAREANEKQGVGFFLDLAGTVSGQQRLRQWAKVFRDHRYGRGTRSFFPELTKRARYAAEENTPMLAKRWGLRMNMPLETFQSMYQKHTENA